MLCLPVAILARIFGSLSYLKQALNTRNIIGDYFSVVVLFWRVAEERSVRSRTVSGIFFDFASPV